MGLLLAALAPTIIPMLAFRYFRAPAYFIFCFLK